jgi:hypothetical protein
VYTELAELSLEDPDYQLAGTFADFAVSSHYHTYDSLETSLAYAQSLIQQAQGSRVESSLIRFLPNLLLAHGEIDSALSLYEQYRDTTGNWRDSVFYEMRIAYIENIRDRINAPVRGDQTSARHEAFYKRIQELRNLLSGKENGSDIFSIVELPQDYALHQAYPNPFNPTTTIRFDLPETGHVKLAVYNVLGREVAKLVDRNLEAGYHTVQLDGSQMASGMYFYQMQASGFIDTKKVVLIK